MPVRASALTGAAGEHYVAYKLSQMGCAAGLTRGGSPGVDLMVCNPETGAAVSIQVKTSDDAHTQRKRDNAEWWAWRFGQKTVLPPTDSRFYAFVSLHDQEGHDTPVVFIVPSAEVVKIIESREWSDGWVGIKGPDCDKWRGDKGWHQIIESLEMRKGEKEAS